MHDRAVDRTASTLAEFAPLEPPVDAMTARIELIEFDVSASMSPRTHPLSPPVNSSLYQSFSRPTIRPTEPLSSRPFDSLDVLGLPRRFTRSELIFALAVRSMTPIVAGLVSDGLVSAGAVAGFSAGFGTGLVAGLGAGLDAGFEAGL